MKRLWRLNSNSKRTLILGACLLGFVFFIVRFSKYQKVVLESRPETEGRGMNEERERDSSFLYFAYASDISESRLKSGGGPSAKFISTGFVKKRRFSFSQESKVWKGGVADMLPSDEENDVVWGAVYRLKNEDADALDKQKGVGKVDPLYEKILVDVELSNNEVLKDCVSFVMVDSRRDAEGFLPSPQYKQCIVRGAKELKLPKEYVGKLERIKDNGSSYRRKGINC